MSRFDIRHIDRGANERSGFHRFAQFGSSRKGPSRNQRVHATGKTHGNPVCPFRPIQRIANTH